MTPTITRAPASSTKDAGAAPALLWAVVCNEANFDQHARLCLTSIVDHIAAAHTPAVVPRLCAVVALAAMEGRYELSVALIDPEGEDLMTDTTDGLSAATKLDIEWYSTAAYFIVDITLLPVYRPGRHVFVFYVDSVAVGRVAFRVEATHAYPAPTPPIRRAFSTVGEGVTQDEDPHLLDSLYPMPNNSTVGYVQQNATILHVTF